MTCIINRNDKVNVPDGTIMVEWHKNKPIRKGQLPDSVKELRLYSYYNRKIEPDTLPDTIERIIFGLGFDRKIIPGSLPSKLRYIELSAEYNRTLLPGSIPETVKHIVISNGNKKRLDVGVLPNKLSVLEIYREGIRIMPNALPDSLKVLVLGCYPLPLRRHILPQKLEKLVLHAFMGVIKEGTLPETIKHLEFRSDFNGDILALPPCLEYLYISESDDRMFIPAIVPGCIVPECMKTLVIGIQRLSDIFLSTIPLFVDIIVTGYGKHDMPNLEGIEHRLYFVDAIDFGFDVTETDPDNMAFRYLDTKYIKSRTIKGSNYKPHKHKVHFIVGPDYPLPRHKSARK